MNVRETLVRYGADTLSDAQLLEALLTTARPGRAEGYCRWSPERWVGAHRIAGLPLPSQAQAS